MTPRTILILEDDAGRIAGFEAAVATLGPGFRLWLWRDAPTMLAECRPALARACLISLDHDLAPKPGGPANPGTGLEVAEFLGRQPPVCPVLIHTSNSERRWTMHKAFRAGHWRVGVVLPAGDQWSPLSWRPRARALIAPA